MASMLNSVRFAASPIWTEVAMFLQDTLWSMVQSQGGTVRTTPDVQRFAHELWDYAGCRTLRGLKGASSAGCGHAPAIRSLGSPIFPSLTARLESWHSAKGSGDPSTSLRTPSGHPTPATATAALAGHPGHR